MSLFFEDEIRRVKDKASPSELKEIMSQDPRVNGQMPSGNRRASLGRTSTHQDASRNRHW